MTPLVSVLIPCYNAEKYVEKAIRSILDQTYKNIEVIAINDCSSDSTLDILQTLSVEDSRIIVVNNEENLKIVKTLNKGIDFCQGDYIARMDSDDIALPDRIKKQVNFLEKNTSCDLLGTLFNTFRDKNPTSFSLHTNPLKDEELRAYMLFKSGICHPSVMIRKRVFTELGLRFEQEYLHVEDYAFWSKAIYQTHLANLGEPLLLYRVHENQISTKNNKLQLDNKKKVFSIHMQKLGIEINDETLSYHASIAECIPEIFESIEYLKSCELYMCRLIDLNSEINFCNQEFLIKMLSIHWLRLCANSRLGFKALRVLKTSKLYNRKHYNQKDVLILYFKVIFKIKYKESRIYHLIFG